MAVMLDVADLPERIKIKVYRLSYSKETLKSNANKISFTVEYDTDLQSMRRRMTRLRTLQGVSTIRLECAEIDPSLLNWGPAGLRY